MLRPNRLSLAAAAAFALAACGGDTHAPEVTTEPPPTSLCDRSITVPDGFCARVFHTGVGAARQLAVAANGDVFVAIRNSSSRGGVVALRDTDGDGRADLTERWGDNGGSGIALGAETLYLATESSVLRYALASGSLTPVGTPQVVVSGLPANRNHRHKSVALHPDGWIFVGIGSPGNACQDPPRTPGVAGKDPCDALERRAGVWRFRTDLTGQGQSDGVRFATGVRNAAALAVHPTTHELYSVVHGRDQLRELWPQFYSSQEGSENPSEEFVHLTEGADFGWPYCYHDPGANRKILAPEYGGDGSAQGRCADVDSPELGLPAHWAPNAMAFSVGEPLPEEYRDGAFVAFHGSWNRSPVQGGYSVVWVPFRNGSPTGDWEVFADGFSGGQVTSPAQAAYRPTGVAVGSDGAVYVSDSKVGRIWRIGLAEG